MEDKEEEFCYNCKRDIPSRNYVMHTIHCQRNIALCPKCREPFPRVDLEKHCQEAHSLTKCPDCKESMERSSLENHRKNECMHRLINCEFCELELAANKMNDHVEYCGSRTELCEGCGEYVVLKYMKLHLDSGHKYMDAKSLAKAQAKSSSKSKINGASTSTAVNILNSSKRTNDKPQINSTSGYKKFVDKPSLRNLEYQDIDNLPSEELDHLIAMCLAEHEDASPCNGSDFNAEAFFDDQLPPPPIPSTEELDSPSSPHAQGYRSLSPLLRDDRLDLGFVNSVIDISEDEDEIKLPCEFCDMLVPPENLVLHQSGCACNPVMEKLTLKNTNKEQQNPNPLLPSSPASMNNLSRNMADLIVEPDSITTLLPCEFCGMTFPDDVLLGHQVVCELNDSLRRSRARLNITHNPSSYLNHRHLSSRSHSDDDDFVDSLNLNHSGGLEDKVSKDLSSLKSTNSRKKHMDEKGNLYLNEMRSSLRTVEDEDFVAGARPKYTSPRNSWTEEQVAYCDFEEEVDDSTPRKPPKVASRKSKTTNQLQQGASSSSSRPDQRVLNTSFRSNSTPADSRSKSPKKRHAPQPPPPGSP